MQNFSDALLTWFDQFGRKNLPWQEDISPYRVWISEIMLQQTQVATVIPYFNKFIADFPQVKKLAQATLDSVLHLWTGLGYYARARNLHQTAAIITQEFNQIFPNDLTQLVSLPGIGRSTAGAILSIAFNKPTPILDGNVKRVLTRYHALSAASDKSLTSKLWDLATEYTPQERCAEYTQAIMDLGATVCTRSKPNCLSCPLQFNCKAYQENKVANFPQKRIKTKLPTRTIQFLILCNEFDQILLEKRSLMGIWGGLWSFPEYDQDDWLNYCEHKFNCEVVCHTKGTQFRHTFSHFHLDIEPLFIRIRKQRLNVMERDVIWYSPTDSLRVGVAGPVKKLLQETFKKGFPPSEKIPKS